MISVLVQRIGRGLYPSDGVAEEELYQLPSHVDLRVDIVRPTGRSPAQLRLYWAVLSVVAEGMQRPIRKQALHQWVKLKCGVIEDIVLRTGEIIEVPGSIALDAMDEGPFNNFFDRAMVVICAGLTAVGRVDLLAQAEELLDREARS